MDCIKDLNTSPDVLYPILSGALFNKIYKNNILLTQ